MGSLLVKTIAGFLFLVFRENSYTRANLPGYDACCQQVPRRLVPYVW